MNQLKKLKDRMLHGFVRIREYTYGTFSIKSERETEKPFSQLYHASNAKSEIKIDKVNEKPSVMTINATVSRDHVDGLRKELDTAAEIMEMFDSGKLKEEEEAELPE